MEPTNASTTESAAPAAFRLFPALLGIVRNPIKGIPAFLAGAPSQLALGLVLALLGTLLMPLMLNLGFIIKGWQSFESSFDKTMSTFTLLLLVYVFIALLALCIRPIVGARINPGRTLLSAALLFLPLALLSPLVLIGTSFASLDMGLQLMSSPELMQILQFVQIIAGIYAILYLVFTLVSGLLADGAKPLGAWLLAPLAIVLGGAAGVGLHTAYIAEIFSGF